MSSSSRLSALQRISSTLEPAADKMAARRGAPPSLSFREGGGHDEEDRSVCTEERRPASCPVQASTVYIASSRA
eukprot:scaffold69718_cov27-Tisochrysis_lutea.AAC.4